ncbi:hypothetical protein G9A89_015932 [Geosiphon pyriformis]|nr:hypothetical protein G9A89_015932 [Geosiphon pyriformis]
MGTANNSNSMANLSRQQNDPYTRAFNGPHSSVAKLLLRPSLDHSYLHDLAHDFLSSESQSGKAYTLEAGFRIFFLFVNVATAKLATKESPNKEKADWVKTLLQTFRNEGFLGVVSAGGFLKGYQLHKSNAKRGMFGELISEVEKAFLNGLDTALDTKLEDPHVETITFLCGRCFPYIPKWQMSYLKKKTKLLDLLTVVITSSPHTFNNGKFLSAITKEINSKPDFKWTKFSQSYKDLELQNVKRLVERFNEFATTLYFEWENCPLSRFHKEELIESETKQATPLLWSVFKTIIFTVTMIYKKIVQLSFLKFGYWDTEDKALLLNTYSHLYFIAIQFDLYGFSAYKYVLFAVLDQLMEIPEACNRVVKTLVPAIGENSTQKTRLVFYLIVTEKVMEVLEDETVEKEVLPTLHPYLKDTSDINLFESSHSTVLAILSTKKRVTKEFSPFYSNLLLEGYPDFLSIEQLRAAYTTLIASLSDIDNTTVWYCLENLLKKIEGISPFTTKTVTDLPQKVLSAQRDLDQSKPENATSIFSSSYSLSESKPQGEESTNEKNIVEAALHLRRGHLLLTLIDQIGTVNLIFLEVLLAKIKSFIEVEPYGIARLALQKALFDSLSTGLDYTKKETGIKWWLSEGRAIAGES